MAMATRAVSVLASVRTGTLESSLPPVSACRRSRSQLSSLPSSAASSLRLQKYAPLRRVLPSPSPSPSPSRNPHRSGRSGMAPHTPCVQAKSGKVESAAKARTKAAVSEQVDWQTVGKLLGATAFQIGAMTATMAALQVGVIDNMPAEYQQSAVVAFFLFCALRSRVFSPLDAKRPTVSSEKDAISERKRPSWMPPPLVFPIVWSTIAILRGVSSGMVWQESGGELVCLPLLAMVIHLSIGDLWNHINNVRQDYGFAVLGVFTVLASAIAADAAFFSVSPSAGWTLAPMVVWLTVATALVTNIWLLNDPEDNPLLPRLERGTAPASQ